MKLLVIGSGMMGSAAAYDMARQAEVQAVTLADADVKRAREVAARINRLRGDRKVKAVSLDASSGKAAAKLMKGHDAALSAVPYFLNLGLAKAAIEARCHFADLGGNNTVVRQELSLSSSRKTRGCSCARLWPFTWHGLNPGWRTCEEIGGTCRCASTLRGRPARENQCRLFTINSSSRSKA